MRSLAARAAERLTRYCPGAESPVDAPPALVQAALRGFQGGLVATAVMTAYRVPVFRALPPTAEFWARYVGGGGAERYFFEGLGLHFLYGGAGGALLGAVVGRADSGARLDREGVGVLAGLVYGLALSAFGSRVVFPRVLGRELKSGHALVFHVGHAVYGLTLGTWLSARERPGDVYD